MFRAILLQVVITIATAILADLAVGMRGAISAAAGGVACTVPNLLFALRLRSVSLRRKASYTLNFFFGEFAKIILTIALLVATVKIYPDLHWPSMLIGLVLASQAMLLAFWKRTDHVDRS